MDHDYHIYVREEHIERKVKGEKWKCGPKSLTLGKSECSPPLLIRL